MNNNVLSSKRILLIATMLSAMMMLASSMPSLVPTRAFAQDVIVDPIAQTSVQADANVNADTHVITDEENCEEANDQVNQATAQSSDQEARRDGQVGANGVFVSPKVQTSTQLGLNINADTDVILAECNPPNDQLNQANTQSATQTAGSDVEGGEGSTIVIPIFQRQDHIEENIAVDTDVIRPVP